MPSRSTCKNCVFLTKRPGLLVTKLVCAAPAKNNAVVHEDDPACPEFMGQFASPGLGLFKSFGKGGGRASGRTVRPGTVRSGGRASSHAGAPADDGASVSSDDLDLEALEARAAAAEARAQALEAQAAAAEARAARARARQASGRQEAMPRSARPTHSTHSSQNVVTEGTDRSAPRGTSRAGGQGAIRAGGQGSVRPAPQGTPRTARPRHGRPRRPEGE